MGVVTFHDLDLIAAAGHVMTLRPATEQEKQTLAFLAELGWLDVDQALADLAGDMARQYVKSHPGVDTVDYLVAASVEALEAEPATTNLKHFPMFSGLKKPH